MPVVPLSVPPSVAHPLLIGRHAVHVFVVMSHCCAVTHVSVLVLQMRGTSATGVQAVPGTRSMPMHVFIDSPVGTQVE